MAIALVASTKASLGANGGTTGNIDTSGANLIVGIASAYPGYSVAPSASDSKSCSWNGLTVQSDPAIWVRMFWTTVPATVGSGHNFSVSGTGFYGAIAVLAFSGVDVSPLHVENGGITNSPGVFQASTGPVTPGVAGSLVVAGLAFEDNSAGAVSIDSGFSTPVTQAQSPGVSEGVSGAYLVTAGTSTVEPIWNITNQAAMAAVVAVFNPAPAGSGQPARKRMGAVPFMGTSGFGKGMTYWRTAAGLLVPQGA